MIYETLFETLKKKSKKSYNSNLINKYKDSIKKTWDMKEIIGKSKFKIKKLPHKIVTDKKGKEYSKVLHTIDYKTLIQKLERYGIKHQYIDWFKRNLNSLRQYVCYSEATTFLTKISSGVPQGLILGPLLSLKLVNDLQHVTKFLIPIMFPEDTNIFYSNSNINKLFENVNKELASNFERLKVNLNCLNKKPSLEKRYFLLYFALDSFYKNVLLKVYT